MQFYAYDVNSYTAMRKTKCWRFFPSSTYYVLGNFHLLSSICYYKEFIFSIQSIYWISFQHFNRAQSLCIKLQWPACVNLQRLLCPCLCHFADNLQRPACNNLQRFYDALLISIGRYFITKIISGNPCKCQHYKHHTEISQIRFLLI